MTKEERKAYNKVNKLKLSAQKRAWKNNNPDKVLESDLNRRYGVGAYEWYKAQYQTQNGCCAICGSSAPLSGKGRLVLDHNHNNKCWRALLCRPCNSAIGLLGDKFETIMNAANYVRKYGTA